MSFLIDPPQGWLYGFPKVIPCDCIEPEAVVKRWLVANGYPQHKVWQIGEDMFVRIWETPDEEIKPS